MLHLTNQSGEEIQLDDAILQQLTASVRAGLRDAAAPAAPNLPAGKSRRQRKEQSMTTTVVTQGQASPAISNVPKFDNLLKEAAEAGATVGKGTDSWGQFLLKVGESSFLAVVDLDKDKHGKGVDDAWKLAEAYASAQNKNTIFNTKAPKTQKLASCIRTMTKFGMFSKGGQNEPLGSLNKFVATRQDMRKKPEFKDRMDDLPNSLLKYARAQNKRDDLIPATQFQLYILKAEHKIATEADWLSATRKAAQRVKAGTGGTMIETATADLIIRACGDRLTAIAKGANT